MIFVTVGTDRYPFDRLVRGVEDAYVSHGLTDEITFQYGSCIYSPGRGRAERFLPFEEVRTLVAQASIVVTHGGVGSIGLCLGSGKKPIVLPRRSSFREAIDDHQVIYAERMAQEGCILLAHSEEELARCLVRAVNRDEILAVDHHPNERKRLCEYLELLVTNGFRSGLGPNR